MRVRPLLFTTALTLLEDIEERLFYSVKPNLLLSRLNVFLRRNSQASILKDHYCLFNYPFAD